NFLGEHHIDLIFLYINMPVKNGLELLTELRAQIEAVDVIVISAASELDVIKKTLRYGAVEYLIKPLEFERFQTALSDY
ncbi:response regulator, partial [Bacillus spizizenii]|uniref:response regulator n=1 Tax=Bacillus spizizenii TaxID=96241 RepID=UPI001F60688C